jgi:hypothetical protein
VTEFAAWHKKRHATHVTKASSSHHSVTKKQKNGTTFDIQARVEYMNIGKQW